LFSEQPDTPVTNGNFVQQRDQFGNPIGPAYQPQFNPQFQQQSPMMAHHMNMQMPQQVSKMAILTISPYK